MITQQTECWHMRAMCHRRCHNVNVFAGNKVAMKMNLWVVDSMTSNPLKKHTIHTLISKYGSQYNIIHYIL